MNIPFSIPSTAAVQAAFTAEYQKRQSNPRLAVFDPDVTADQVTNPAVHARALALFRDGHRSVEALQVEIVKRSSDPSATRATELVFQHLRDASVIMFETDVVQLMRTGFLAFADAAAPPGHAKPFVYAPAVLVWRALVDIVVMRDGGGGPVLTRRGSGRVR